MVVHTYVKELLDDQHSCAGGAGSQPVSLGGWVAQICKSHYFLIFAKHTLVRTKVPLTSISMLCSLGANDLFGVYFFS